MAHDEGPPDPGPPIDPADATEPAADAVAGHPAETTGVAGGSGSSDEVAGLLAVIDRLEGFLERSELTELEVEAGGTVFVLRTAAAVELGPLPTAMVEQPVPAEPAPVAAREGAADDDQGPERHAILAPLTGLFYASPAPGAAAYVRVGTEVNVGQVIGLIEAMKLFNEIKSDVAGTVTRILAESGDLVKAKQPLIEIQPA